MKNKLLQIKPQDLILALKLVVLPDRNWRMTDVADSLFISQSEVSNGLERLLSAKLVDAEKKKVLAANLFEFLVHGLKYVFPGTLGSVQRGMPTAYSAKPVSTFVNETGIPVVWPWSEGEVRGETLAPLYPTLPMAAAQDDALYELLVLCDTIRIGRAREHKFAVQELKKRLIG
ncbi:MAG: hypothetical protein PHC51_08260 [bacterium]|nr:hypothetical protein [bacterium]